MFTKTILLVLIANGVVAAQPGNTSPSSDVLTPVSGHDLFGILKSGSPDGVTFLTDSGVQLTIPWDKIRQIHTTQTLTLESFSKALPGRRLTIRNVTMTPQGKTLTITSEVETRTLNLRDTIFSQTGTLPTKTAITWSGSIAPKFSLVTGTQSVQTLGGQLFLRRTQNAGNTGWQHQDTTLTLEGNNALTEQKGSPSIRIHEYDGALAHSIYLAGGLYAVIRTEQYHNSALNLYLQQTYGGGLGKRAFANEHMSVEVLADGLYIAEHFYGAPGPSFAAPRIGERIGLRLGSLKGGPIILSHGFSYTPAPGHRRAWQTRGVAQVVIPITKSLGLNLNFTDDYLENAPNGRQNYSSSTVGVNFQFNP